MALKVNSAIAVCGGKLLKLSHFSSCTGTDMDVNLYLPKQYYTSIDDSKLIPSVLYLSGLTCTPQNASEKAFWQIQADKFGFAVVFPDTSPRGDGVATDPEGSWDFGFGAGFYVNATEQPYSSHYKMYDYVHKELPEVLAEEFGSKVDFFKNISITGHSMGGFGALSGYLKNINRYKACSAFAPIVNPSAVPWGEKAFTGYLGSSNKEAWDGYDPTKLIKHVENLNGNKILIHVGSNDPFLEKHLRPHLLQEAAKGTSWEGKIEVNLEDGFDHSYYFISTFVPQHAEFHAKHLGLI